VNANATAEKMPILEGAVNHRSEAMQSEMCEVLKAAKKPLKKENC
jgi:hypothetical protein